MVMTDGTETTYTTAERLFYSAIAEFSAMLTADTEHTYKTLLRALSKNVAQATTASRYTYKVQGAYAPPVRKMKFFCT